MIELRDYQKAAIDDTYGYWAKGKGDNPLIVAPTGAGKSLIIASLIQDACSYPGTRILMLTHVKELLQQNAEELLKLYPQADIGFYSASIGQKRLDRQITFAGIQSVWKQAFNMVPAPDLVLVDEAHLIPKNSETRYGKFLADLKVANPKVKIIGLTATPYRLDSGLLTDGDAAIFDGISYDIPVSMLMERGYLAPLVSKPGKLKIDLSQVKKRGGEYIEKDLAIAASDPELVRATVAEIVEYGRDRKSWLVFASGVAHADLLREEFLTNGVAAEAITGGDGKTDRDRKIADFKAGRTKCLINVNVLTAGFNAPAVDLVALVRATLSTSLYVQMCGRGTRTAPGKIDCLVLDYGQNVATHGFFDQVRPPRKSGSGKGEGEAPVKECPSCEEFVAAGVRRCPNCDHEFPPPTLNHSHTAYSGAMMSSQVEAEWVDVEFATYQRHKKAGKPDSVKVTYNCGLTMVNEWLCPEHGGYAQSRYEARMQILGATAKTTADALIEAPQRWKVPGRIKVKPSSHNPKYMEIVQLDYHAQPAKEVQNVETEKQLEPVAEGYDPDDWV